MHDVRGLIANQVAMRQFVRELEAAVVCALPQGFGLLPLTDSLTRGLCAKRIPDSGLAPAPLAELFPKLHDLALGVSEPVPVAYISTDYFGGEGGQDAGAWDKRASVFSPMSRGYSREWPDASISQALRAIGVAADAGKDEFDSLGLGDHRKTLDGQRPFPRRRPRRSDVAVRLLPVSRRVGFRGLIFL